MTAHGIISTGAEILFHTRTWMAETGSLELHATNLKYLVFERVEVDPGYEQVSTQQPGVDRIRGQKAG